MAELGAAPLSDSPLCSAHLPVGLDPPPLASFLYTFPPGEARLQVEDKGHLCRWGELPGLADWQSSSSLGGRPVRVSLHRGFRKKREQGEGTSQWLGECAQLPILPHPSSFPTLGSGISWGKETLIVTQPYNIG